MKERIEAVRGAMARKETIVGGCCGSSAPAYGAPAVGMPGRVGGCGGGYPYQYPYAVSGRGDPRVGHYPSSPYPWGYPYWGSNVPNQYPYSNVIPNLPMYTSMYPYATPFRPLMRLGQWM